MNVKAAKYKAFRLSSGILVMPCVLFIVFCNIRLSMATVRKVQGQDEQYAKKYQRRRADARWRANLARCYETLKLVIPLTTRASKKQISKVVQLRAEVPSHCFCTESLTVLALQMIFQIYIEFTEVVIVME